MRVVVTGAAGFVGSCMCRRLLQEEHEVVGIDDFTTGNHDNVADLIGQPRFEFLEHDVAQFTYLKGPLDGLLHFARSSRSHDYHERPLDSIWDVAVSTHRTLELARLKKARYLLVSSSEVYGEATVSPQPESYTGEVDPVSIRGMYSEAVRFAESLTSAYHGSHGVSTRIVRLFNFYGLGMAAQDGSVISNFIIQAVRGEPLTIYGDGSQLRAFGYIDDIVEGQMRLFFSDHLEPINLGGDEAIPIKELAELIVELVESKSEIMRLPHQRQGVRQCVPHLSRAKHVLDWEPSVPLREGLSRTIPEFRSKVADQGITAQTPVGVSGFL